MPWWDQTLLDKVQNPPLPPISLLKKNLPKPTKKHINQIHQKPNTTVIASFISFLYPTFQVLFSNICGIHVSFCTLASRKSCTKYDGNYGNYPQLKFLMIISFHCLYIFPCLPSYPCTFDFFYPSSFHCMYMYILLQTASNTFLGGGDVSRV